MYSTCFFFLNKFFFLSHSTMFVRWNVLRPSRVFWVGWEFFFVFAVEEYQQNETKSSISCSAAVTEEKKKQNLLLPQTKRNFLYLSYFPSDFSTTINCMEERVDHPYTSHFSIFFFLVVRFFLVFVCDLSADCFSLFSSAIFHRSICSCFFM